MSPIGFFCWLPIAGDGDGDGVEVANVGRAPTSNYATIIFPLKLEMRIEERAKSIEIRRGQAKRKTNWLHYITKPRNC